MSPYTKEPEVITESLFTRSIKRLTENLDPVIVKKKVPSKETINRLTLSTFVESTSKLILEPWQNHLCEILQSLTYTRGRRILVHKPPQHGGSVIVSQRFPAYVIGDDPEQRVKLACYNITHATKFTEINRNIMQSGEYLSLFENKNKNRELYIPNRSQAEQFSTKARSSARDGQPSLQALGLETGFVGQGADTLIIDDPYASPQAATSKLVCASVWKFWTEGASVRIDDDANVVVMFHRYHEDDFVGQLIKEEGLKSLGGVWELFSYRAEWDGDIRPEIGGPDPMKRSIGEYLSPRKARQPNYYKTQKRRVSVWQSQFQGKPTKLDGDMFNVSKIRIIYTLPTELKRVCRAWDIASTADGGDYTVGVLMGLGIDDIVYILDVIRVQKDSGERDNLIRRTANRDRVFFPDIKISVPQDPSSAGKDQARNFTKLLKGHSVVVRQSFNRGNKEAKADPFSGYVNMGLCCIVYAGDIKEKNDKQDYISWVPDFLEELRKFPKQNEDDQVDAASDAFSEIALGLDQSPGESIDLYGLSTDESDSSIRNKKAISAHKLAMEFDEPEETAFELYLEVLESSGRDIEEFFNSGYSKDQARSHSNSYYRSEISRLGTAAQRRAEKETASRRSGYS